MKSYNHLWEQFISEDNVLIAINNSSQGKRDRRYVRPIYENPKHHTPWIIPYACNFHNSEHIPKEIYDGITRKKRQIIVPEYKEQIVHHMCVNVLIPIFTHGMYEHSYASIPDRGAHKAKKFIERWIRQDYKHTKYYLKMDIRKFFDSIPHEILERKLRKIIHDERFLGVLHEIISVTDHGLPLGFYTSQWIANWYLQDLDHYIKEVLGAEYYVRYMDDMVIMSGNKRKLHKFRKAIAEYLKRELGLELKDNWQVSRITECNCIDFMGFRFFRNRTTLRKSIFLKAKHKARRIAKKDKTTVYDARQMISYLGWFDATDTYWAFQQHVSAFVNVRQLKRKVASYDRRKNNGMEDGRKQRETERAG